MDLRILQGPVGVVAVVIVVGLVNMLERFGLAILIGAALIGAAGLAVRLMSRSVRS